jgi:succinate dehydrogenase hydrophobic anchor subunit
MEMVIEDYVQDARALHWSLLLNTLFTAAVGVAALYAILKMSFGS